LSLEQNDIYILDKNGRTIYFNTMNEINYDSKFFIFNKTFYKDRLVKIFEENVDKINGTFLSSNNLNYMPSNIILAISDFSNLIFDHSTYNNQAVKLFEKHSTSPMELKKIADTLLENFENAKTFFKALKLNVKICEKIRDNYSYQYNSLECIYKNISVLYE